MHAADLRDTRFKANLAASEVIADQLSVPAAEEDTGVFANTTLAEVVNDRSQIENLPGGVGPLLGLTAVTWVFKIAIKVSLLGVRCAGTSPECFPDGYT